MPVIRQLRSGKINMLSYNMSHPNEAAYMKTISFSVASHIDSLMLSNSSVHL